MNEINNTFKDIRIVEGIKQPKNLLRLLSNSKTTTDEIDTRNSQPGLFDECTDPRCNLCKQGYIQKCSSFKTSNGEIWKIKTHINCGSKNVLYFLMCNMCQGERKESKTGKTWTTLRERMNNHISECRSGKTSDLFDIHVHECGTKNKCLNPPYFKIYAFMKLSSPAKLLTYEKWLHSKGYDTMNR